MLIKTNKSWMRQLKKPKHYMEIMFAFLPLRQLLQKREDRLRNSGPKVEPDVESLNFFFLSFISQTGAEEASNPKMQWA